MRIISNIDEKIFMMLYKISDRNNGVKHFMRMVTLLSSKVFIGIYGLYIVKLVLSQDKRILPFLVGPALCLSFVSVFRKFYSRKRPFETLGIESFVPHDKGGSFPSKHSSSAFVIAFSILFISPSVGCIVLLLAFLTGLSRIMVGVHYPFDILGGMFIGLIFSYVAFILK